MVNIEEIKQNKVLNIIGNLLFGIIVIILGVLIFIAAKSKFTGQEPSLFNHRLYIVDSGSMSPTINLDSMIIVKELRPEEVAVGDIITYYGHNKSSRVTHRVMGIENDATFITKGDANDTNDPMTLEGKKVIGKVVYIIPFIGKVFRFLNTRYGLALLITIAIAWMVLPRFFKKEVENKHANKDGCL